LPVGGGVETISGSNQIDGDPRRLKQSLQAEQVVVWYFVGAQLLMTSSYHAGFTRRIPSDDFGTKARKTCHPFSCPVSKIWLRLTISYLEMDLPSGNNQLHGASIT